MNNQNLTAGLKWHVMSLASLAILFQAVTSAWAQQPAATTNSVGMKLVQISLPQKSRSAKEVLIGATEVTQAQFKQVMGTNPSTFTDVTDPNADAGSLPVESVTWQQAVEFCDRLSKLDAETKAGLKYLLPTEQEWEAAASAHAKTAWFFSDKPFRCDITLEPAGDRLRSALNIPLDQGAIVTAISPDSLAASHLQKDDIILTVAGQSVRDVNSGISILRANRNKKVKVEFLRQPEQKISFEILVPEGNDLDQFAWYSTNSSMRTHAVGMKRASPIGLFDVYGNVGEWCSDYLDAPTVPGTTLVVTKLTGDPNDNQLRILRRHLDAPDGFLVTDLTAEAKQNGYFQKEDVLLVPTEEIYNLKELVRYYDEQLRSNKAGALTVDVFRAGKKIKVEIPKERFFAPNAPRAVKGGAYHSLVYDTQTNARIGCESDAKASSIGFRVIAELNATK